MRAKELADLAGTTVRTIRHYHALGLLPVPDNPGQRDYTLAHLARLLRIRWLTEAGLSLDAVASVIDHSQSAEADLRATLSEIDTRLAELHAQRERMEALIALAEAGHEISPVPDSIRHFYDQLASRISDGRGARIIAIERYLASVLMTRMVAKPLELSTWIDSLTDEDFDTAAAIYQGIGELPTSTNPEKDISALVDRAVAALRPHAVAVGELMSSLRLGAMGRMSAWLGRVFTTGYTHPHQLEFVRRFDDACRRDPVLSPYFPKE